MGKGNRSIFSSERLLFRLFDFFDALLLDLVTVELEGAGLGFPALFLHFASSAELSSEQELPTFSAISLALSVSVTASSWFALTFSSSSLELSASLESTS